MVRYWQCVEIDCNQEGPRISKVTVMGYCVKAISPLIDFLFEKIFTICEVGIVKKIQYSVYKQETGNAGGKAKNDIFDILVDEGFCPSYYPSNKRIIRILQQIYSIEKFDKDTRLIIQYPAVHPNLMKRLNTKLEMLYDSTAIIHDLPSIQGMGGDIDDELRQLKKFDNLIVHNSCMRRYLEEKGYKGNIVELDVFDYLHDATKEITQCKGRGIISIAGNLDKSRFIMDLAQVNNCKFLLYGINNTLDLSLVHNAQYLGLLNSEEIVYKLEGDYGLVWDGDSINACTGIYGRYLKYNNPHKLSLYIAAGKPIITWKQAAIAEFVNNENIGITVNSLDELNHIDLTQDYWKKRENVMKIKKKLADGYYTKKALRAIYE